MKFTPRDYQNYALTWLIQKTVIDGQSGGAFLLDPGLGKTSTTLSWVRLLKALKGYRTLIVAPLRVMQLVWPAEVSKWDQFNDLTISMVHGSEPKRLKALQAEADIYLTSADTVPWLSAWATQNKHRLPFELLVVDESTKFKTCASKRTKALRWLAMRCKKRLMLTGTPAPNGLEDLFPQMYFIDDGQALGRSVSKYREKYFYRGGYGGYKWLIKPGSESEIHEKIAHLCLRLNAKDHLDMPEKVVNDVWVEMPPTIKKQYKKFEREMFIELSDSKDLTASNAGVKYNMCRQLANGGIYDEDKNPVHLHNVKLEAADEIRQELQGKPILVAFQYRHDAARIKKFWPSARFLDGSTKGKEAIQIVEDWNAGKIEILAVQPKSLSHGINMQSGPGRDIIWLGLTDDLDQYIQFNARVWRQGVTSEVRIHRILCLNTVDEAIREFIEAKDRTQTSLLDALTNYRGRHAE